MSQSALIGTSTERETLRKDIESACQESLKEDQEKSCLADYNNEIKPSLLDNRAHRACN